MWEIDRVVSKGEYNYAVVEEHPNSTQHGYVLEHRIVMENHLGRLLKESEIVHHINEDKKDNKLENLKLMKDSEHKKYHQEKSGRKMVRLKCPECEKIFTKRKGQTHLQKSSRATFCSRSCSATFNATDKEPHKVKKAISENVLEEFTQDNSEVTEK